MYIKVWGIHGDFGVCVRALGSVWRFWDGCGGFGVDVGAWGAYEAFGVYVGCLGCTWRLGVYMEALGGVWRLWGVCDLWEHTQKAPPAVASTQGSEVKEMVGVGEGRGILRSSGGQS